MNIAKYRRRILFWAFVLVGAYLVYVYPIVRISEWYGWPEAVNWQTALVIWIAVSCALWLSFNGKLPLFKPVLVNWMGIGFILFSLCVGYELVRLVFQVDDHRAAQWILVGGAVAALFSFVVAQRLAHKHLEIRSPKLGKNYRLVQISDVHIGSRSKKFLRQIVVRINELNPDYVMITGDLMDTSKVGHHELSALQDIRGFVFFIIGNHERYAGLDHVVPVLESLGLSVLRNESVIVEDIQVIGIDDADDPNHVARTLPTIEMHQTKFRILLYHRPHGWSSAVMEGIELMLSGHTHNGQIFPFNWIVKQQFKLIKGLYRDGGSHLYVSPGTGTWGPVMRLGSRNEITCIDLVAEV